MLNFREFGTSVSGKTKLWTVENLGGTALGSISWYAQWRCYAFNTYPHVTLDKTCLREIADRCEMLTKQHKGTINAS